MLRFSIRELLLVTLLVAIGFAWWVDHRQLAKDRDRHKRRVELIVRVLYFKNITVEEKVGGGFRLKQGTKP